MKKILVTGGAGFLGSHLCERLLQKGEGVICVDNFYSSQKSNIDHLLGHPNFEFIEHDIVHPLSVDVDQIYNLACPASPVHYQKHPVQTIRTCVHGAINMLDLSRHTGAKILQASTSEVYGDPEIHPQPEEYWGRVNPIGVRSCYDEGKRCAETLFFDYHRQYGVKIKVIRIFNTYGPRMQPDDGRVISNFIMQCLSEKNITIYGGGSQTRSFCYVDDLITGMISMMETSDDVTGPINIGSAFEFTIKDLAELAIAITESKSIIEFCDLPLDDPRQRKPDIAKARDILGWEATTLLQEGLRKTIQYFEAHIDTRHQLDPLYVSRNS